MLPMIQPTKDRNTAVHAFDLLRIRALRAHIWAKLSRKETHLATFPKGSRSRINRKFIGVQEIPLDKITGTLGREDDFDNKFRPRSNHLRERWVEVFIDYSSGRTAPILVHKIGEQYYIEDGHHRTSVARAVGMAYIQAEVWEYAASPEVASFSQPCSCSISRVCKACPA